MATVIRTVADWKAFIAALSVAVAGDVPVVIDPPPIIVGPPPLDVPAPGEALNIVVHHIEYAWDDVSSWVSDRFHDFWSLLGQGASVARADVEAAIIQAINFDITAWSSFINQLNQYAQYIAADMSIGITDLGNFVLDGLSYAENLAQGIGDFVGAVLGGEIAALGDRVTGLEHLIYDAIDFAAGGIEAWAIDNIYHPLLDEITRVERTITGDVADAVTGVEDWVRTELNAETLARIAAIAGIATAAATALTWIEDCGAGMCETVGPNTDWGKWLKLFGPLAIWAMLAAVAAENPNALEGLATDLADTLGPVLETWVTQFALGGGGFSPQPSTVGGAIGSNPLGIL